MSLCIAVIVNGPYQRFIPTFTYFCIKSYPEYGVKIFLTNKLRNKYVNIMNTLGSIGDVEIKEDQFLDYPKSNQELKALRWMLKEKHFNAYDNVYIGDVDILICRENISLEKQHLIHCNTNDLPYSNMIRPNVEHRFSGLHFIRRKEYYKHLEKIIEKYSKKLKSGGFKNFKNEELLYNMIDESVLNFPSTWFWSHHGIHLGWYRNGNKKIRNEVWDILGGKKDYKQYYEFFSTIQQDELYKEVYKIEPLKEIKFMKESLLKDLF